MKSDLLATPEFSKFAGILSVALSQHQSFRIWNSSTGIPSPPLALFIVILPKAHLTLHSRMSGSRWVITPLWLSGSWKSFLYSSSVYSCLLFLISSAYVRSMPFLSFIEPIFAWNVPLVSLSFLKRSLDFPILLFSSMSLRWSAPYFFVLVSTLYITANPTPAVTPYLPLSQCIFFSQAPVTTQHIIYFVYYFSPRLK